MRVLVTGATGYIGGRLVPELLAAGHQVKVVVRDRKRITGREWSEDVEVVECDLRDTDRLREGMRGVDVAYYLVHSMSQTKDFREKDRELAHSFVEAAKEVPHTVYLGGLQPKKDASPHLASRAEVGEILREKLPATEFRAGPIIGSGSASFEMVRYLTERLPLMITPRWVKNEIQPIAVADVLKYLVAAIQAGPNGVVDLGGDKLTFKEMLEQYAYERGLKRYIILIPLLTGRIAGLWVGLVTPLSNQVAVPLMEGIDQPLLRQNRKADELFPEIDPMEYRTALRLALNRIESGQVATRWSGSVGNFETFGFQDREGILREERTLLVDSSPEYVFDTFTQIGGETGWHSWSWAWKLRGLMDQFIGGPGLRRGRRVTQEAFIGETIDFFRVEELQRPEIMRLRAEMKVPGYAWLQFEAKPEAGATRLIQTALFEPRGLFGYLYWWVLYPFHYFIFRSMIRRIAEQAERLAQSRGRKPASVSP